MSGFTLEIFRIQSISIAKILQCLLLTNMLLQRLCDITESTDISCGVHRSTDQSSGNRSQLALASCVWNTLYIREKNIPMSLSSPWARSIRAAREEEDGCNQAQLAHNLRSAATLTSPGLIGGVGEASPDSSNDRLDRGQQVLYGDLTVAALVVKAVVAGHVGVCCSREMQGKANKTKHKHLATQIQRETISRLSRQFKQF